jgi:hypothetical protein
VKYCSFLTYLERIQPYSTGYRMRPCGCGFECRPVCTPRPKSRVGHVRFVLQMQRSTSTCRPGTYAPRRRHGHCIEGRKLYRRSTPTLPAESLRSGPKAGRSREVAASVGPGVGTRYRPGSGWLGTSVSEVGNTPTPRPASTYVSRLHFFSF